MKTLLILSFTACLISLCGIEAAASPTAVSLRGFGKLVVTPRFFAGSRSSWVTLTAQDPAHAAVCASKFLADLYGFGDVKPADAAGLPGTVAELDGAAWWLVGVDGGACQILCARTRADLASLAHKAGASAWKHVPPAAYPRWLDCMDNAAMGFWFLGGGALPKDVNDDFAWLGENGFTGCVASGVTESRLIAPGVLDSTQLDWYGAMAAKYRVPFRTLLNWTSPMQPPMVWNRVPLPYIEPADGAQPYDDFQHASLGVYDGFVPTPATDPYMLDLRRKLAAKEAADPNFVGHHGSAELGGQTIIELSRYARMPSTIDAWREFLRTKLGLTLAQVGLRYLGNAKAYSSWSQVDVPSLKQFTGWGDGSIDLSGDWQGHADPSAEGADWPQVRSNDVMLLQYASNSHNTPGYWLRRSITLTAEQCGRLKALHIARAGWHGLAPPLAIAAYLNGKQLVDETVEHPLWPDQDQCVLLGDAARPGENHLVLRVRGPLSYVFLSPAGRWAYPSDNPHLNQLWCDATDFTVDIKLKWVEHNLMAIRQGDPDRPIKIMAPWNVMDKIGDLCLKYGAYPHDTGQGGACWAPWMARYVTWRNIQASSEPGGPAGSPAEMRQAMTLYLMLGNSIVDYVFHVDEYRKPDMAKWIADNREMLRCIGKMDVPHAKLAVLRSLRDTRLGFKAPWAWDIARGEAQAAGRTADYVDLPDFASGRANAFKIIFDDGTAVLSEGDIAAIESYVRQGGIFIATNNTGLHTPSTANAWPICRLTGLAVKKPAAPFGNIQFSGTETLIPSLRGRQIKGEGQALDWLKGNQAGESLALAASAPGVNVIATWADRAASDGNIAVASRRIGKGEVVTLGSTFWRDAQDSNAHWISRPELTKLLDEMLSSLGVERDSWVVNAPELSQQVWAEHWRSKNGIYDLFPVARINGDASLPSVTASVKLRGQCPAGEIRDLAAIGHPSVTVSAEGEGFSLPPITLQPMESHVYAAPRVDIEHAAIYWLGVQERQWPALAPVSADALPAAPKPSTDTLALTDGWKMTTGGSDEIWTAPGFNDRSWKTVAPATFAVLGLPEDAVARLRRTVSIPRGWAGKRVSLVFDAPYWFWGVKDHGRLWINGRALPPDTVPNQHNGSFTLDVSDYITNGRLTLALEVDGKPANCKWWPRPAGVSGTFLLQATPIDVKTVPLTDWKAATDLNVFTPLAPNKSVTCKYVETTFDLPAIWPASRLFLESDQPLRWIVLNDRVVSCPDILHELDISRLAVRGRGNVLRWVPVVNGVENPAGDHKITGLPPAIRLGWRP